MQNQTPVWSLSTFSNAYSSGETLNTQTKDLPGNVSFSCTTKGQLYVSVWRTPLKITDEKPRRVIRRDTKQVKIYINGVKQKKTRWYYSDGIPAIRPAQGVAQAVLYNAAVRGDEVTLAFRKEPSITLILPKPNEAFAKFGANCGFAAIS